MPGKPSIRERSVCTGGSVFGSSGCPPSNLITTGQLRGKGYRPLIGKDRHMFYSRVLPAFAVLLVLAGGARSQERDLREQFGTQSLEAAKNIQQAIQLSQAKKHKEALAAIEEALKADKQCQMAYFQKALILSDLGDIEEA